MNESFSVLKRPTNGHPSDFLTYLAQEALQPGTRLPAIQELAKILGISTGKLREQLEIARQMGIVEIRPKTGIRMLRYSFFPTMRTSLLFALALDQNYFHQFGVLRNIVETSFWKDAVRLLLPEDHEHLRNICDQAWEKLRGRPIQIPHQEHRELHLRIYSRLENTFVTGILEGYWEAYETVGLNVYEDYTYLQAVWTYHTEMVNAIINGDLEKGHQALIEHIQLLQKRPQIAGSSSPQNAEEPQTETDQHTGS